MRQILATPAVHLLAFFILVYVGIEVTIGGKIPTEFVSRIAHGYFDQVGLSLSSSTREGEDRILDTFLAVSLGVRFDLLLTVLDFLTWCRSHSRPYGFTLSQPLCIGAKYHLSLFCLMHRVFDI